MLWGYQFLPGEASVGLSIRSRNLILFVIVVALLGFALPLAGDARAQARSGGGSTPAQKEIREATMLFYAALNSALHGDLDPLSAVWSHSSDVSELDGVGARAKGWTEVRADFRNMARLYPDGRIEPQDILVVADGDIGYSVCTETGQLRSPEGPMVKFTRRATNIFRREDGRWKMVHRHTGASSGPSQGALR
jgi:ketosteroid isomerase-like protein